jgi:acetyltransferase-like isoleucine patch superfamily enzyme
MVNAADITSRVWRYGAAQGNVLGSLVFRKDGRIGGYLHPNEAFWRLTEQMLEIRDANGAPSRRFLFGDRTATGWPGQAVASQHRFWIEPNTSHPIVVTFDDEILQAAKQGKFYLSHLARQEGVYGAGDAIILYPGADIEPGATLPTGALFKIGAFSYVVGLTRSNLSIGRYCSIAAGLSVFGSAHPTGWLSSSPMTYAPHHQRFYVDAGIEAPPPIMEWEEYNGHITTHIGNDVWIGADVLLKPGITIGNGAVIAARSVITKDVPPYAIMGGAPARVIKYRFEAPLLDKLNAIEWWKYDLSGVQLDWRDASGSIDAIAALLDQGSIAPLSFPHRDYTHDILATRVLPARGA